MSLFRMILKELLHQKGNVLLSVLGVAIATATLVGSLAFLKLHDIRTEAIMEGKLSIVKKAMAALQEEMRKATLELTFNVLILPKDQNLKDFYADDYAGKYMPEEYVERLAGSGTVVVRHFLPSLTQKIEWPEHKRTIILIGSRGEVANLYKDPRKPLVQSVPPGSIVLGHELHQSLGLRPADTVRLMGREFKVHRCHEERGNKDDITAWIFLSEAQELLQKKGQINSILALECVCAAGSGPVIRKTIEDLLPGTQVIEMGTKILARQESRVKAGDEARDAARRAEEGRRQLKQRREQVVAMIVPIMMTVCVAWVGFLAYQNVRARSRELGILRAIGVGSGRILILVLSKALLIALPGGFLGFGIGILAARHAAAAVDLALGQAALRGLLSPQLLGIALVASVALTLLATWIPALVASRQDPAVALRGA